MILISDRDISSTTAQAIDICASVAYIHAITATKCLPRLTSAHPKTQSVLWLSLQVESTTEEYEKVAYSYAEEVAYVTILWSALVAAITWFFLRYANRSLFKWHTVSRIGSVL